MSISIYYKYRYGDIVNFIGDNFQNSGIYKSYCATYDLYTGKKIQLSDLFFEGEDYSTELYELMQSKMSVEGYGNYIKRDFTTLEKNYEKFTLNSIFFDKQNTVFSEGAIIPTEYYYTIFPVITIGRNMKGIFNDKIEINEFAEFGFRNQIVQTEVNEIPYKIPKIKHWDDKIGEKINTNIEKYMEHIMKNYKDILNKGVLSYDPTTQTLKSNGKLPRSLQKINAPGKDIELKGENSSTVTDKLIVVKAHNVTISSDEYDAIFSRGDTSTINCTGKVDIRSDKNRAVNGSLNIYDSSEVILSAGYSVVTDNKYHQRG